MEILTIDLRRQEFHMEFLTINLERQEFHMEILTIDPEAQKILRKFVPTKLFGKGSV